MSGEEVWLNSGSGNYNQSVMMSALELARFGLLHINGGIWNGQELLPKVFVRAATTGQVSAELARPQSSIDL